jgi:hypothetical protein
MQTGNDRQPPELKKERAKTSAGNQRPAAQRPPREVVTATKKASHSKKHTFIYTEEVSCLFHKTVLF